MAKICEIYETGGQIMPQASIKPGVDCIAQYSEDSQWYRASIEEVTPEGAKVLFVDYANKEVIPFDKIKELHEDVCNLPAQAFRVKLLAAVEKTYTPEEFAGFESAVEAKAFEAEFVGLTGSTYEILMKEVGEGQVYLNEKYCDGADLMKAKELVRNKSRKSQVKGPRESGSLPDYAPMDLKWKEPAVDLEGKLEIMVTWAMNPHNFYCQSLKAEKEFRQMMNNIQKTYAGRTPIDEPLEVGSAVMAVFADDGAIYRAEILELNKLKGNVVRYVDFGNRAMVDIKKTFRVEKQFLEMPKQAFNCTLKNVVPINGGSWNKTNSQEIDRLFNAEKLECCFYEVKDNKYSVGVMIEGKDMAGILVEKGLAEFAVTATVPEEKSAVSHEKSVVSQEKSVVSKEKSGVSKDKPAVSKPALTAEPVGTTENAGDVGTVGDVGPAGDISVEIISEQQPVRIDISRLEGQRLGVKVSNVEGTGRFHVLLPSAGDCEKGVAEFMAGKDAKVRYIMDLYCVLGEFFEAFIILVVM